MVSSPHLLSPRQYIHSLLVCFSGVEVFVRLKNDEEFSVNLLLDVKLKIKNLVSVHVIVLLEIDGEDPSHESTLRPMCSSTVLPSQGAIPDILLASMAAAKMTPNSTYNASCFSGESTTCSSNSSKLVCLCISSNSLQSPIVTMLRATYYKL